MQKIKIALGAIGALYIGLLLISVYTIVSSHAEIVKNEAIISKKQAEVFRTGWVQQSLIIENYRR